MKEIKYHFAFDENCNIVCIDDLSKEDSKSHSYRCIQCGDEMEACIGRLKRPYFRHKVTNNSCSSESYLHKLAKIKIAEHFLKTEHFYISYSRTDKCKSYTNCKYAYYSCNDRKPKVFDLKSYYQTCEIEKQVKGKDGVAYIADICLCSNNANFPPVLIEICVTHPCSEAKKLSGLKIIEIPIRKETDIINICSIDKYKEFDEYDDHNDDIIINFYNFIREATIEMERNDLLRFIHTPGKESELVEISCKQAKKVQNSESDLELNLIVKQNRPCSYDVKEAVEIYTHIKSADMVRVPKCEECYYYDPYKGPAELDNFHCSYDHFRRRPVKACDQFHRDWSKLELAPIPFITKDIEQEFVKGEMPKEYHLAIVGAMEDCNPNLIEQLCNSRISELLDKNLVLCAQAVTSKKCFLFDYSCYYKIPFKSFAVDWNKHGKSAGYKSNEEIIGYIDELIVLNTPNDNLTKDLIQKAHNKKIRVSIYPKYNAH